MDFLGAKLPVPRIEPVVPPPPPYYSKPTIHLERNVPVLSHEDPEQEEETNEESFTTLMARHVDSLTTKVTSGPALDRSDLFMAVYNVRLLEDVHLGYQLDYMSTKGKTVSFDAPTRTLYLNPEPFLAAFETYPHHKLVFLAYVGLTIHYYVNLKLKHPGPYSLDTSLVFSEFYNQLFETIATLVFKEEGECLNR